MAWHQSWQRDIRHLASMGGIGGVNDNQQAAAAINKKKAA